MTISDEVENIERLGIDDLTGFQGGLKKLPEKNLSKLINSIKTVGFSAPFFAFKSGGKNWLLDGHQRLTALKKMRENGDTIPELPVVFIKAKNKAEAKKKLLFIASQYGKPDQQGFEDFTAGLDLDFLEDIEIPEINLEFLEEEETSGDDDAPEAREEAVSQPGEIYELGNSLLMCGDSTDPEAVKRLMGTDKVDMVFTDPPYGVNVVKGNKVGADFGVAKKGKYNEIISDDTTETAKKAYQLLKTFCDRIILWGGNYFMDFLDFSTGWLIWDKRCDSGIKNTFADGEMAWCSFHTPVRIYHQLWNGMIREGERGKREHPTQKPINMLCEVLKDFTKENDIILDGFGGSGSVLIACEKTDRKCRMVEVSTVYCDVIRRRWTKWAKENNRPIGSGGLE